MKIFVTGSSSHLARALLPLLCSDPEIEFVSGVDLRPPVFSHPKFHPHILDVREAQLEQLMLGHTALVHMAFVVLRGKMPEHIMRATNIDGTLRVFQTAISLGYDRLINLSSASVYGSGVFLSEDAPFNPLPGFLYAQQKVEAERVLKKVAPRLVQFRPHVILGPNAQPLLKQIIRFPFYVRLADPQPQLQAVHESDVAQAIFLALKKECQGAFNLAPDDQMSFLDIIKQRHRFGIPVSEKFLNRLLNLAWEISGWGGETAWLQGASQSLSCSNSRAKEILGWQPVYSTEQTIKSI